jgi:hypothetical protein
MNNEMSKFDADDDGKLSESEFDLYKENQKLKSDLGKQEAQKRMAWTAIYAIIAATIALFLPVFTTDRITAIGDPLGLFYISMAGIVGAFMGMTAYINRR